jgi:D-alanyl-D-alanine carboxypeptidase-like protein
VDRDPRRAGALLITALTLVLAACSAGSPSAAPASAPAPSIPAPSTPGVPRPTVPVPPSRPDTGATLDRGRHLPGMITADGPVVAAFRSVGWTWGGGWSSPTDLMHFSSTGH